MKTFLYVTDLHGNRSKYERIFRYALEIGAGLVINGGDIAPHARHPEDQRRFYQEYLGAFFERCQEAGIRYLTLTGNDDLGVFDELLDQICEQTPLVTHFSQRMVEVDGYWFIGMNRVTDFPFRSKTGREWIRPAASPGCRSARESFPLPTASRRSPTGRNMPQRFPQ